MIDHAPRPLLPLVLCGLLGFIVALDAHPSHAQQWRWPEDPENLQVLPETITSRQLRVAMISFVQGLGVRCSYCHVGEEGASLATYDFASDDKPEKEKARIMMRMVQAINDDHLPELGVAADELTTVTCTTCHRRATQPRMLGDVLMATLDTEGVEAMVDQYRQLRSAYYGGFTYDFGENTLNRLGYQLLGAGRHDEAIAVFRLNTEMYPESGDMYDSLAEGYMTAGDTTRAVIFYQRALALDPSNDNAVEQLLKLKEGG